MGHIFDPENLFFRTVGEWVDLVGLSLLWAILCLPIVTIGPATAALYHTVYMVFRKGERDTFRRFFRSLRLNLKTGLLSTLALLPVVLVLALLGYWYQLGAATQGSMGRLAFSYFYVLALLPLGLACWLFPLLGRFEFPLRQLFSTAGLLALGHLPTTLLVILLTLAVYLLIVSFPLLLFLLPALWALLLSFPLERVFAKHAPANKEPEDSDPPSQHE
jgi:uncharacterized membrane protein YesL